VSDEKQLWYCLKCRVVHMDYEASLCPKCLGEEFDKMDHGDPSGYLYAAEQYLKYKKQRDKDGKNKNK